eukprot:831004-Prorocentrum_minimum.AAC.1
MTPEDVVVYDVSAVGVARAAVYAPTRYQAERFEDTLQCCTRNIFKAHLLLGRFGQVVCPTNPCDKDQNTARDTYSYIKKRS